MKQVLSIAILSSFFILLFGYTAITKLWDFEGFKAFLTHIPYLSMGAGFLSLAIPLAEVCVVLLLLFSRTRLLGIYGSILLLSLFTLYLVAMLAIAPELPCSCGGVIGVMGWWEHLGMNVVLVVAGVRVLGAGDRR